MTTDLVERARAVLDEPEADLTWLAWLYVSMYWHDKGRGRSILRFAERPDVETVADILVSLKSADPGPSVNLAVVELSRPQIAELTNLGTRNADQQRDFSTALGVAAAIDKSQGHEVDPRQYISQAERQQFERDLQDEFGIT